MPNRSLAVLVGGALAACVAAAPAVAAPSWKPVTPPQDNLTQVGLARTADGTLHLAWPTPSAGGADLMASTIAANGAVGGATPITQGWVELGQPALFATGSELHVYFAGNHSQDPDDVLTGLDRAVAPTSGTGWTLGATKIDPTGSPAYTSDVSAVEPGGTPLVSYSGQGGTFVHVGLDPVAGPFGEYEGQLGNCCGYDTNLAVDAKTGATTLAWFSNAPGHEGAYLQPVNAANGQGAGGFTRLPGTTDKTNSRIGLVSRVGGGVYAIYPTGSPFHKSVVLWKVGGGSATVAKSGNDHPEATLATTPDGRLWAVWGETLPGSRNVVEARRSNKSGTVWGAVVSIAPPHGVGDLNHLEANGQKSPVDVLAHYTSASSEKARTYATQLFPGITVKVKVSKPNSKGKSTVTVTTLDAGDKLGGVKIKSATLAKVTNKKTAAAKFKFADKAKAFKLTLIATKTGYTPLKFTVKLPASGK
jgi:hypothetical protein